MLTHTGRTYRPGAIHPIRCECCEAPASWLDLPTGEPRCSYHAPGRQRERPGAWKAERVRMLCQKHGFVDHYLRRGRPGVPAYKRCARCKNARRAS